MLDIKPPVPAETADWYNQPMRSWLLLAALLIPVAAHAAPPPCGNEGSPQLLRAQFTSGIRSDRLPQDRISYLTPGTRLLHLHTITTGTGRITYRWFRDGMHVMDVAVAVGPGEWRGWSRLRLTPPDPAVISAQLLGPNDCLLQELTLPASAFAENDAIRDALGLLATGDTTGARIALNTLLEQQPARSVARDARRLLETDVALAQAMDRVQAGEVFLVDESLRQVEQRLGNAARDRALREQLESIRKQVAATRIRLAREWPLVAAATRHLLETEKLFTGDYPLERADAERLIVPALQYAGDTYAMVDWQPTLRGYRLLLQDRRTGDAIEVTPD